MRRAAVLVALLLLWIALGPWVAAVALGSLLVPRVRVALLGAQPLTGWSRRRTAAIAGAVVAAGTALVVVIPDGRLPIPPGPGLLAVPSYVGRPAVEQPVQGYRIPQHPRLAPNGRSSMHNDAWASDASAWAGPMGLQPEVDTAWFGLEECPTLAFDRHDRIIALCGDLRGPILHVIDPETMRPLETVRLPERGESDDPAWQDVCGSAYSYLDERDRAVVATSDRRVLAFATSDGAGQPDLTVDQEWDLSSVIPDDDCLVALLPAWDGRIWFASQDGRVGTLLPGTGETGVLDLGEEIANSLAVDEQAAYVVSDTALYRLEAGASGPRVRWRFAYDRGLERKPGQFTRGSGTTPTLLADGLVAITDNAEPRMHVVMVDRRTGTPRCRAAVFGAGESATENSLIGLGRGVIVENNFGYRGPQSAFLGLTTTPGLARVDVRDTRCRVVWSNEEISAPSSVPKVSLATGVAYVQEKRSSRLGVAAWYLTAIDVHTGRRVFSVRLGIGLLFNNNYAAITLAPDGSAYVGTLGGMVRVRDRG